MVSRLSSVVKYGKEARMKNIKIFWKQGPLLFDLAQDRLAGLPFDQHYWK